MRSDRCVAIVAASLAVAATAVPALLLRQVFESGAPAAKIAIAALAGGVVGLGLALTRLQVRWIAVVLGVAFAAFATVVVLPDGSSVAVPGVSSLEQLGTALVHGLPRFLSVAVPAPADGQYVVIPSLIAWAGAAGVAVMAMRTQWALALVAPPIACLVGALMLAGDAHSDARLVTVAVVLPGLTVLILRARSGRRVALRDGGIRIARTIQTLGAGAAVGVVVVVALAGGPVGGDGRYDPRSVPYVELADVTVLNPLVTVRSQLEQEPPSLLAQVRVDAPEGVVVDRIRLASLDRFDGARWYSDAEYRRSASTLPAGPGIGSGTIVRLDVDLLGLDGPFVPTVGQPTEITGLQVGYDPASAVAVARVSDLVGTSYGLTAQIPVLPSTGTVRVSRDSELSALPPGLPSRIGELGRTLIADAADDVERLRNLEEYLVAGIPYSLEARPGHSYAAVSRFLFGTEQERAGYAEQRVSAFAILARSMGYPTRISVGYLIDDQPLAGDSIDITTADAHAWPEVLFDEIGWVAFEPTDPERTRVEPPPDDSGVGTATVAGADGVPFTQPPPVEVEPPVRILDEPVSPTGSGGSTVPLAVWVLAVLALIVAAPALVRSWIRRRRRTARTTAGRVIGAWRDSLGSLTGAGIRTSPATTIEEVRDVVSDTGAGFSEPVSRLAPLASYALFAPDPPDDELVEHAWALAGQVRRGCRDASSLGGRAMAYVGVRPSSRPNTPARRSTRQR